MSPADLSAAALAAGLAEPSIVIQRLSPPEWGAAVEADRPLYPASMIKVPIAAALWSSGAPCLNDSHVVADAHMTANDAASPLVPGYLARVEELADLMLTRSDNVATNVLIDAIGRERATAYAHACGLRDTAIRRRLSGALPLIADPEATGRNAHPARDAAHLFMLIAKKEIAGAEWLRTTLERQRWNEKLSRGLRTGDRFAHKTGDTDEVTHDGGILQTEEGGVYVVVVYTALSSSPEGDGRFADFMRRVRPLL